MIKEVENIRIFVYGTLLTGFGNWSVFLAPKEGIPAKVTGFKMFSLGGFPGLMEDETSNYPIIGETFIVSKSQLARCDGLEGCTYGSQDKSWYYRKEVETDQGELAWVYYFSEQPNDNEVTSGDWRDFVKPLQRRK